MTTETDRYPDPDTDNIQPGYIVSLRSEIVGGREYSRRDLALDAGDTKDVPDAAKVAKWETTCVIEDPEAWEAAKTARGAAVSTIWKVCVPSPFGLLCPIARRDSLLEAIRQAREIVAKHNEAHPEVLVHLRVVKGAILAEDHREIVAEVKEAVATMDAAVRVEDPAAARAAAVEAKGLSAMMAATAASKVLEAVKAARARATEIAKAQRDAAKAVRS